ncbi:MAG: 23S rRNA (pseudouridine(1915)-N(3))-methyltransferase RlmH [Lachnospiraceae bacterium]|nr:23S rRNA (pseudouridine(1915)-N(3))-methyltransferase RlmH [Lachnospiraceae bacterium]
MNVEILCVGKLKESYLQDAVTEYKKRLSKYCHINILEVADEKTIDKQSEAQDEIVRNREGERLIRLMREQAYVITLEISGKMMDSFEFAKTMEELAVRSVSDIQFVIGGSLGLSKAVMSRADLALSFSKMTFPHQLMRVILLEQIYRGYRIINHEPYHK